MLAYFTVTATLRFENNTIIGFKLSQSHIFLWYVLLNYFTLSTSLKSESIFAFVAVTLIAL